MDILRNIKHTCRWGNAALAAVCSVNVQRIGAAAWGGAVRRPLRFTTSFFGTLALKDAAALLLFLPARTVFVFALRHLLLADLAHEVKEDLCAEERTLEMRKLPRQPSERPSILNFPSI